MNTPCKRPVGRAIAKMKHEPGLKLRESAGTGEIGDEIGVNERRQGLDCAKTPRQDLDIERRHNRKHQSRQERHRSQQPKGRHARSRHDDEFAVAVELVEGVKDPGKQRHRPDDGHKRGQRQSCHHQEDQNGLAFAGDQVDLPQRLGDPDDAGQDHEPRDEAVAAVLKKIAFELDHCRRIVPRRNGGASARARPAAPSWCVPCLARRFAPLARRETLTG